MSPSRKSGTGSPKGPLVQLAYEAVRRMILTRELPSGTVIQERKLADSLSVSRTPMREALGRLEGEGLLARLTERLLAVRVVTLDEFLQTVQVRRMVETEAIVLATPRMEKAALHDLMDMAKALIDDPNPTQDRHWAIDTALHRRIGEATGNLVLADTIDRLRLSVQLFEIQTVPMRIKPGCQEHLDILGGIDSGDPTRAKKAMRVHLDHIRGRALDDL